MFLFFSELKSHLCPFLLILVRSMKHLFDICMFQYLLKYYLSCAQVKSWILMLRKGFCQVCDDEEEGTEEVCHIRPPPPRIQPCQQANRCYWCDEPGHIACDRVQPQVHCSRVGQRGEAHSSHQLRSKDDACCLVTPKDYLNCVISDWLCWVLADMGFTISLVWLGVLTWHHWPKHYPSSQDHHPPPVTMHRSLSFGFCIAPMHCPIHTRVFTAILGRLNPSKVLPTNKGDNVTGLSDQPS